MRLTKHEWPALHRIAPWLLASLGVLALLPGPARAAVEVLGKTATLSWPASAGPVAGYAVYIFRNGSSAPQLPARMVGKDDRRVEIQGSIGATARVRVAAFDENGHLGPLSPPSRKIRFVNVLSNPSPSGGGGKKSGGSGSGSGGGSEASCSDPVEVVGLEKLRVTDGPLERELRTLRISLCGKTWWSQSDAGSLWSGTFERGKGSDASRRKLQLELDGPSEQALLAALGARVGQAESRALVAEPRRKARIRAKTNGKRSRVIWSLDLKLDVIDPASSETRKGRYRMKLDGPVPAEIAATFWP